VDSRLLVEWDCAHEGYDLVTLHPGVLAEHVNGV
jgi:hypothetical protein